MYVTLNISATSLRLLSVKGRSVERWGSAPLSPGLVRDGLILQPQAVGAAIAALFESTQIPREPVIISLTGLSFTYRVINLPRMKPARLEEAIIRAAQREILLPLEELYLSWQAVGGRDSEQDFFVLGVPRNLIEAVVPTLGAAGVEPYIMDLRPLALARAAHREEALVVALEPDCFDIVLVAGGVPVIMHSITPRGEGASLEDNLRRLTDELSKTVEFYNSSHQEGLSPATPLLLTGELAAEAGAIRLIQAGTGHPVAPLTPSLDFPPDLPLPQYAANMGLALKRVPVGKEEAGRFRDISLNLLAYRHKARAHPVSIRQVILALALIIVIGLLSPMYLIKDQTGTEAMRLQAELDRSAQELRQVRLAFDESDQTEATISEMAAEVAALRQEHQDILGEGGDLAGNLGLVTGALPAGADFTSIEVGGGQITVRGEADGVFTVVSYAAALEALGVFPEVRIGQIDQREEGGVTFSVILSN